LDDFSLLTLAVGAIVVAILFLKDYLMVDVAAVNAQVDATINVMAAAIEQLQADVAVITNAAGPSTAEAVAASMARLKQGTDQLVAAVAAAKAAGAPK
jgi:hypothetical protein